MIWLFSKAKHASNIVSSPEPSAALSSGSTLMALYGDDPSGYSVILVRSVETRSKLTLSANAHNGFPHIAA